MDLVLLRGPLETRRLEDIARLYGPYNRKYADPGFCARLFNDNPHGYSLHSFVTGEDGRAAGHYAVIPMSILDAGERRLSGKGEAFVVDPVQRRDTVTLDGRTVLCGPALQLALLNDALDRGIDVIHMVAGRDIAVVHRMTGCRALGMSHLRSALVLRPEQLGAREEPDWKATLRAALGAGQRAGSALVRNAWLGGANVRHWTGAELTADRLQRIASELPAPPGWGLAIDVPMLTWMAAAGSLRLIALDDSMGSWALLCTSSGDGRLAEVLAWRERGGVGAAVRLLAAIVECASESKNAIVGFSDHAAPDPHERQRLRAAGRSLLFFEREQPTDLFIRSKRHDYDDPSRLQFTPFLTGIF